jgi:CheY-like chemotaxis protein
MSDPSLNPRALVVDDVAFNRRLAGSMLKQDGWLIEEAGDADSALQELDRSHFDLVLLDLDLGVGKNGYDVLGAIREHPALSALPVILVTGSACTPDAVARGLLAGAQDYITKPFDPLVLRARAAAARRAHAVMQSLSRRACHASQEARLLRSELDDANGVQRAALPRVPLAQAGMLMSGETIAARRVSGDTFDFVVDAAGAVSIVLLDVAGHGPASGLVLSASREAVRRGLLRGRPMDQVIEDLQVCLRGQGGVLEAAVALGVLRFSPGQGEVEILNAGLPPIVTATREGGLVFYPCRSAPVGLSATGRHAVERVAGSGHEVWMMLSDGLTDGSLDEDSAMELARRIGLARHGAQLAVADAADLHALMVEHALNGGVELADDATLVLAARDRSSS